MSLSPLLPPKRKKRKITRSVCRLVLGELLLGRGTDFSTACFFPVTLETPSKIKKIEISFI